MQITSNDILQAIGIIGSISALSILLMQIIHGKHARNELATLMIFFGILVAIITIFDLEHYYLLFVIGVTMVAIGILIHLTLRQARMAKEIERAIDIAHEANQHSSVAV